MFIVQDSSIVVGLWRRCTYMVQAHLSRRVILIDPRAEGINSRGGNTFSDR